MKKEVFIAIFIGLLVGLLIAFGIYNANQALKKNQPKEQTAEETTGSSPLPSPATKLTITSPENNLVFKDNEATVSGQTEPQATIAVLGEEQEELLLTDNQGLFSTKIGLISGINEIKVISISKNGDQQEKKLNLIYSKAEIE